MSLNLLFLLSLSLLSPSLSHFTRRNDDSLSDDIVIIHTNDVHCGVNDTIGYDGFVLYREELKQKYKHVITADVGDNLQGGALGAVSLGEAILKIMNYVKYDVATLGNHEFDYGIEQLNKIQEKMTSKYICSNFLDKDKKEVYEPYKIIEAGDKKIGFIGVVTPLTFSKTYISSLKESDGSPSYNFLPNYDDLASHIQKYINELRNDKNVDYVILLTHIGMDLEEYTSNGLVSRLENVDAVLDGHTHKVYSDKVKDKNNKEVPITQTGTKLGAIGELVISKEGTITSRTLDSVPEPEDKTIAEQLTRGGSQVWVHKETHEYLDSVWKDYEDYLNTVDGKLDFDMKVLPEDSESSQSNLCRLQECTLGDLIGDSYKEMLNADIGILNGGSVRSGLLKGDVTHKKLIDVAPFFNSIFLIDITGEEILDTLEFSVSKLNNSAGAFLQVSGITFDVNTTFNSPVVRDSDGAFEKIADGERRVSNVRINGQKVDKSKKYVCALSEYLSSGGDGYSMLTKCNVTNQTVYTGSDILIYYISGKLNKVIPDVYRNTQGRINLNRNVNVIKVNKGEGGSGQCNVTGTNGQVTLGNFEENLDKNYTLVFNLAAPENEARCNTNNITKEISCTFTSSSNQTNIKIKNQTISSEEDDKVQFIIPEGSFNCLINAADETQLVVDSIKIPVVSKPKIINKKINVQALTELSGKFSSFPKENIGLYYYILKLAFTKRGGSQRRRLEEAQVKCYNKENIPQVDGDVDGLILFEGNSEETFDDNTEISDPKLETIITDKTNSVDMNDVLVVDSSDLKGEAITFIAKEVKSVEPVEDSSNSTIVFAGTSSEPLELSDFYISFTKPSIKNVPCNVKNENLTCSMLLGNRRLLRTLNAQRFLFSDYVVDKKSGEYYHFGTDGKEISGPLGDSIIKKSNKSSGLSGGAIAAIVVSSLAVVLLGILGIILCNKKSNNGYKHDRVKTSSISMTNV